MALGLCLFATQALANTYRITNNTGELLSVTCSPNILKMNVSFILIARAVK